MHPFVKIILAETPESRAEAEREFREEQRNAPTDAEIITGFLRDCSDMQGTPLLLADEFAALDGGKVQVKKLN